MLILVLKLLYKANLIRAPKKRKFITSTKIIQAKHVSITDLIQRLIVDFKVFNLLKNTLLIYINNYQYYQYR